MKKLFVFIFSVLILNLSACGPKAFVKGKYDDVERENLLNDQWSETDMQNAVKALVESLTKHPSVANAKTPPLVIITGLKNETDEHINTQSIMDMARVELMNTGKVEFIDKEARQDIADEYNYQNSGMVKAESKKGPGEQDSADFIINGRMNSITQEVGKDKTVYYKLTFNMTNLKTSRIVWSGDKQIRKVFRKKTIGL